MKLINIGGSSPSITVGELTESVMGVSADKMNVAAYYLRDKIYSDKIMAVIREYSCNALDEHVKHNVNVPVELSITFEDNQYYFNVRDFAEGLDENGVRYIFGCLFESTKSNSNVFTGGFGIGSKSAHSYTNSFEVHSYNGGLKTYYSCDLEADEGSVCPVGKIRKLGSEKTDETGLLVKVPINKEHVSNFRFKIGDYINHLPRNSDDNIIIKAKYSYDNCKTDEFPAIQDLVFNLESGKIKIWEEAESTRAKSKNYSNKSQCKIRMGFCTYPVILSSKEFNLGSYKCLQSLSKSIIIEVPVGYFSIPLSRENIDHNDRNRENLKFILDKLEDEYNKILINFKNNLCFDNFLNSNVFYDKFLYDLSDFGLNYRFGKVSYSDNIKNNLIIWIPNNRVKDEWKTRIKKVADLDVTTNYVTLIQEDKNIKELESSTVDDIKSKLKGNYEIISCRKLEKLKATTNNKTYNVSGYTKDYKFLAVIDAGCTKRLSCNEIKYMVANSGIPELKDFTKTSHLLKYCVRYSKFLNYGNNVGIETNSKTLFKQLIEEGFYDIKDPIISSKIKELSDIEQKIKTINDQKFYFEKAYNLYSHTPKIKKIIDNWESYDLSKKEKLIIRFKQHKKIFDSLESKHPLQQTIIGAIKDSYSFRYSYKRLSREELRKIFKIK